MTTPSEESRMKAAEILNNNDCQNFEYVIALALDEARKRPDLEEIIKKLLANIDELRYENHKMMLTYNNLAKDYESKISTLESVLREAGKALKFTLNREVFPKGVCEADKETEAYTVVSETLAIIEKTGIKLE